MTLAEFERSICTQKEPPPGAALALQALWYEAKGDWDRAHSAVQQNAQNEPSRDRAWVHAYLHRKEGDESNAAYWYSRAGRPLSTLDLEEEWAQITRELLQQAKALSA